MQPVGARDKDNTPYQETVLEKYHLSDEMSPTGAHAGHLLNNEELWARIQQADEGQLYAVSACLGNLPLMFGEDMQQLLASMDKELQQKLREVPGTGTGTAAKAGCAYRLAKRYTTQEEMALDNQEGI
jgi:hypothetical protein